jgi:hypothetical protein
MHLDIPYFILLLPQMVHIITACIHEVFHLLTALFSTYSYHCIIAELRTIKYALTGVKCKMYN